jgi:MFS family permease
MFVLEIFAKTQSSFLASTLVVLTVVPTILFSSLAGVYADTFNRKYLLVACNLLRSMLVVVWAMIPSTPVLLLVFAFLLSAASQFFGPAQSAAIPKLVRHDELFSANAVFMSTLYTSVLLGYAIAGPVLHFLGPLRTASILVFTFTISAFLNLQLPLFRDHLVRQYGRSYIDRAFVGIRADLREGVQYIRQRAGVLRLLIFVSLLFAFERAIVGVLPEFASTVMGFTIDQISYFIIVPVGIGAVAALVLGNAIVRRIGTSRLFATGFAFAGVAMFLLSFVESINRLTTGVDDGAIFTSLLAFLSGLGTIFVIVAGQTMLHENTPGDTHGRMFGGLVSIMNVLGLPLVLCIGYLTNVLPIPIMFGGLGIILLVAGGVSFRDNVPRALPDSEKADAIRA